MDIIPESFTHLEVHSHYTLLGSSANIADLVNRAVFDGFSSLALTDRNALYGAVSFSRTCVKAGIKPILGMTVDILPPAGIFPTDGNIPGRLILLAKDVVGYQSLCKLSSVILGKGQSTSQISGTLDWGSLRSNHTGLICISGGRQGWIERFIRAGNISTAARIISQLAGVFEESCYLNLYPDDSTNSVTGEILNLGQRFGLPAAAVQPIYCLQSKDVPRLRLLKAIDQNSKIEAVADESMPAMGDPSIPLFWPNREDLLLRYKDYPEALRNTADIAQMCESGLPDGLPIWPVLPLKENHSPESALRELAVKGLSNTFPDQTDDAPQKRLEEELHAISDHGFAPLFLIVADIVRFARDHQIPVNTRGSVANSLTAYVTGITNVDPIAHDLYFQRFLNPSRTSMPDIDLDFCSRRRDEVLSYLRATYGEDRMALVATVNTFRPRSAIRETAKAYGLSEEQIKKLAALIPRRWHPDPRRRRRSKAGDILPTIKNDREKEVVEAAYELVGQPHHLSVHPGGIVLTPGPLTDVIPVQMAPKGFLIAQFDFRDIEKIGLPKIDLLGIRALTVLADAASLIRKNRVPDFNLPDIPLDDQATGRMLQQGNTIGVFQCESSGARRTLRQVKAKNIDDLAVANAFFKPGPATGGMAKTFIRRYRGEVEVTYLHPSLEPILKSTKGVLLFQEQILRIAREIAGLTWVQANGLRKGMSKFQAEEMASLESDFVTGCRRPAPNGPGFSREQARILWDQVLAFAGYGFNKGHATAYADVSYRSGYLKAHFPAEFFCARLMNRGGFHHQAIYIAEALKIGIPVKPPHINASDQAFSISYGLPPGTIGSSTHLGQDTGNPILWMGLKQVRDLRKSTTKSIIKERGLRPFSSLNGFLARISLQEKELINLVKCGAFDGLANSRQEMLDDIKQYNRAGSHRQLAFDFAALGTNEVETVADRIGWEKEIVGMPVSSHPLELVKLPATCVKLRDLVHYRNRRCLIGGTRIPGWTGGSGIYFSDRDDYIVVNFGRERKEDARIKPWQPMLLTGYWREDEWGGGWFQVETSKLLPA